MLRHRQQIEALEEQTLAPYAVKSAHSQGREHPEKEAEDRTCFQRDRNRIIYSKAFMRLKGKTQVVLAGHGDHFRTRITHTHYVATVARDIARNLGLNEDLSEAIALAHDLGHTCFGHEGQDALSDALKAFGMHFEHNEQSLRIVEKLEVKSTKYEGLNLCFEVRDGLDKHRTAYDNPQSRDHYMPSLEAQMVNIADEIAYKSHDLDDALRAEVITGSDLDRLLLWQQAKAALPEDKRGRAENIISKVMELMIADLVKATDENLQLHHIWTLLDVYAYPDLLVVFSADMRHAMDELGNFLYERFYKSEPVRAYNEQGREVVTFLFHALIQNPLLIPEEYRQQMKNEAPHIIAKDYLAGMTDEYALEIYRSIAN